MRRVAAASSPAGRVPPVTVAGLPKGPVGMLPERYCRHVVGERTWGRGPSAATALAQPFVVCRATIDGVDLVRLSAAGRSWLSLRMSVVRGVTASCTLWSGGAGATSGSGPVRAVPGGVVSVLRPAAQRPAARTLPGPVPSLRRAPDVVGCGTKAPGHG